MELETKIQHFYEYTILDIDQRLKKEIADYKALLETQFEEFKKEAQENMQARESLEPEALKKSSRQELSKELLAQKHILAQKEAEYTEKIYNAVKDRLDAFKKTSEYPELIKKYIRDAIEFAQDDELTIYLDMDDAHLQKEMEAEFGREIRVSEYSFGGGLRALIPAKNILIENSFSTNLQEQMRSFVINA